MAIILSSKHPLYTNHIYDWTLMRDSYKGERQVKSKNDVYLKPTAGHVVDGWNKGVDQVGQIAYDAYKMRARYPNFVREATAAAIGMMHSQPAEFFLPKALEKVRSSRGENLLQLLRRINTEQIVTGRGGLMVDLPKNTTPETDTPYIALYKAEKPINWDDGGVEELSPQKLNFVVLDESEQVRSGDFSWQAKEKYRVLNLGSMEGNEQEGVYTQGIFAAEAFDKSQMIAPSWRGQTFKEIPFTFFNSCDLSSDPDDPALLDLANLCMTIYRTDADYRHNLYMQGQDTFVIIGGNKEEGEAVRVGAGARLDLPMGADAKYVGVESAGLPEQREALDRLEARAGTMGAQTLDSTSRERESGASMRIRVAARTADLNQIADAGAATLETALKQIAVVMGENPDDVKVTPNKEFGNDSFTGQMAVEFTTAREGGFPISARSLHDLARKRNLTNRTFEEEIAEAEKDKNSVFKIPEPPKPAPAPGPGGNGPAGNNPPKKA